MEIKTPKRSLEKDTAEASDVDLRESVVLYRPSDNSVELEVESYTAMRYHGQ